jgi:LuxR family transcriptional regulator, positive regulator of biofilm formation
MPTYKSIEKSGEMTILINLKCLLLCEVLHRAMSKEMNECKIYADNNIRALVNFKPDLILIDSANLSQELFLKWPDTKVILIDTGLSESILVNLMRSFKLYGVLSTDGDFLQLKKALQVVKEGQIWIDNAKLKVLLHSNNFTPVREMNGRFSKKESRIIELVAEGYKNKEIASMLFLSEQTIKSHLGRIFKKMNITNRSQLVSLVIKNKIFSQQAQL